MKNRVIFFIRYFLFLLFFFFIARAEFLIYNFDSSSQIGIGDIFGVFFHGIRLDASISGYLMIFPALIVLISIFLESKILEHILKIYSYIILFFCTILIITDLELYGNWGFRIDSTPLFYLQNPKEAFASTEFKTILILLAILLFQLFLFYFIYYKFIRNKLISEIKNKILTFLVTFLLLISLFLPIRGSLGIAPINVGTVYFSENNFSNHAAINPVWNFAFSISEYDEIKPIKFFNDFEAERIFSDLTDKSGYSDSIFKIEKPNVVIIILESFSSKLIESLNGEEGVCPNMERIIKESVLFTNCYATGDRTDKGLIGILSGYPAQPTSSIMKFSNKTQKLPSISKSLKKEGYNTEWVCGFDINFANMRSYISSSEYEKIIDIEDFGSQNRTSKWGVHDSAVFVKLFESIKTSKQAFFKVCVTLSSHEPFDVPMKPVFEGDDDVTKFLNSVYYTDKHLGIFYDKIKSSSFWENTVIVLVADHGSRHPHDTPNYAPLKFHIPLIWAGGALNIPPQEINSTVSQCDISKSLLSALQIETKEFRFGKNIFSPQTEKYAFYSFNNGFGFITDSTTYIYDNNSNKNIENSGNTEKSEINSKAYIQILMNDFIKK